MQGMKPARFRDAVKLQLTWEDGDPDSPSKLLAIMDAQLNRFEAAEEVLGVRISNTGSDNPKDIRQGEGVGRVGKETASKRNGSNLRMNVDDGVLRRFGVLVSCVGSKVMRRNGARLAWRVTRRRVRNLKGQVRPSHLQLAFRLELGSVLRRRPHRPFHKALPAGRALRLPGNRLCHSRPFRWKSKRRKKGMLIKCRGAVTCAWNILKCFVQSWLGRRRTTYMRRPG